MSGQQGLVGKPGLTWVKRMKLRTLRPARHHKKQRQCLVPPSRTRCEAASVAHRGVARGSDVLHQRRRLRQVGTRNHIVLRQPGRALRQIPKQRLSPSPGARQNGKSCNRRIRTGAQGAPPIRAKRKSSTTGGLHGQAMRTAISFCGRVVARARGKSNIRASHEQHHTPRGRKKGEQHQMERRGRPRVELLG